jgi:hypothetical protein
MYVTRSYWKEHEYNAVEFPLNTSIKIEVQFIIPVLSGVLTMMIYHCHMFA